MRVAVYSKAGKIAQSRWVRFTGVTLPGTPSPSPNPAGLAYEVELPGPTQRAHALLELHPKGEIGPAPDFGFAETLGPILAAEAGATLVHDDPVTPMADGTVRRAPAADRRAVGFAVTAAPKGKPVLMMLAWAGRR